MDVNGTKYQNEDNSSSIVSMSGHNNVTISNNVKDKSYDNTNVISELLQKWNVSLADLFIPLDVIFCLFILFGFFGNCLVVFVYKFRMTGKMKDRYFIPTLAIMDALVCILGPSISLGLTLYPVTFYGDILCKVLIFVFRVPLNSSVLLTFVIGYFRFRKVCISKSSTITLRKCRLATIITIVMSLVMATPMLFFYGEVPVTKERVYGNSTLNVTGCRCDYVIGNLRSYQQHLMSIWDFVYL